MITRSFPFYLAAVFALIPAYLAQDKSIPPAFEKLTELDYRGNTYYTIRNLSLWECQGWCREEPECAAASFSFVLNPLAPIQETLCLLQNETTAKDPTTQPQRAVSLYYMVKLSISTDNVCNRPWTFERVPNKLIQGKDNALIFTSSKEICLGACLNERNFNCRSVEYNYVTMQCYLSEHDRRSIGDSMDLTDVQGIDYFENLCLGASQSCQGDRDFEIPNLGVPSKKVAHYVDLHYYVDKELMANTDAACKRACEIEHEFLCRSFLYKGPPSGANYNCQLFHLDHKTLPDGPSTYLSNDRPLLDSGERIGQYYENVCKPTNGNLIPVPTGGGGTIIVEENVGEGSTGGGITSGAGGIFTGIVQPGTATESPSSEDVNCDPTGTCYDVSVHCKDTRIVVEVETTRPFNGRIYALGRSETCNINVINSDQFRLDLTMVGQDCNTQSATGVYTNTVVIQHHSVVMTKTDKIYKIRCTYDMSSKTITFGMLPIRDPPMIPVTSAPVAPPPRIRILDTQLQEVETVRIGDQLTFRIEIPEKTPYGIFARSCVAMAKDSRSTFQIIDDAGCPVEPAIFPHFVQNGAALQAVYEAFRFTESYGVIFQCNVKYCLGKCEPAKCNSGSEAVDSYGRRRRRRGVRNSLNRGLSMKVTKEEMKSENGEQEMSISQEILVLDLGDEQTPQDIAKMRGQRITQEQMSADENYFTNSTYNYENPDVKLFDTCPTRSSVLALAVTCAILLLIYVLTVFYFIMRKWSNPRKSKR